MKPFEQLPLTVSLQEFCQYTGINRWTVGRLRRSGAIRVIQTGSRHRYLKSEIARLCGMAPTAEGARSIRRTETPHE